VISRWLWRAGWLLLPAAWLLHRFVHNEALVFFVACASLVPLAKTMGDATEELAERMGPAAGSLLNATFGNAAELILGIAALRHGHVELVKGSVTGSILANLLLVGGGSIVTGGIRFSRLRFNRLAASSNVATLFLAVVAMVVPTLLSLGPNPRFDPALLSEEIWRGLTGGRSVHLTDWPSVGEFPADRSLVAEMDAVREVCSAALSRSMSTECRCTKVPRRES